MTIRIYRELPLFNIERLDEFPNKIQRMTQGSKSVYEFYKDLEIALIQANVEEDREEIMG